MKRQSISLLPKQLPAGFQLSIAEWVMLLHFQEKITRRSKTLSYCIKFILKTSKDISADFFQTQTIINVHATVKMSDEDNEVWQSCEQKQLLNEISCKLFNGLRARLEIKKFSYTSFSKWFSAAASL